MAELPYKLPLEDCSQEKDGLDCQEQGKNYEDYCSECVNYQNYLAWAPEEEAEAMAETTGIRRVIPRAA